MQTLSRGKRTREHTYVYSGIVTAVLIVGAFIMFEIPARTGLAATNINSASSSSVAWDDISGWWDFYAPQTVVVSGSRLEGYASSSIGEISLDCATTSTGNICGTSNYGICNGASATHNPDGTCSNAQADGQLSGFAWNDAIGWISFCGGLGTSVCPGTQSYGVTIDSNGNFNGYAWNDLDGWISFNCANNSSCGTLQYLVNTAWRATSTIGYLTSEIYDTGLANGATLGSIIWQGDPGSGTGLCTGFQVAASGSASGPWNFIGPDGTDATYYGAACSQNANGGTGCAAPNTPICVNSSYYNNYRYYRYRARLQSDLLQTQSPRVDDVILNFTQ